MTHKLDEVEFNSRMQAQVDLGQAHAPAHTIPGLVERVDLIETMIGIVGE
jgi:hypothetical protein